MLNRDRIGSWYIGATAGWLLFFGVGAALSQGWGLFSLRPVLNLTIIGLVVHSCAVPFLYSARRSDRKPTGDFPRAWGTVAAGGAVTGVLWELYLERIWWPKDADSQSFFKGLVSITVLFGLAGVTGAWLLSRRRRSSASDRTD